jgi:hypothetical protein
MSSHGNYDNAANAPYWSVNSTIVNATNVKNNNAAPTAANVALLYGNTTSDVYTTGETIGLFMVDQNELDVQESNGTPPAHMGWNLKTTGSGGRAGRVQWETLVALSEVKSDNNSDDASLPDSKITITSQPATAQTVSFSSGNTVTFAVTAAITSGASAPLSYQWQVNGNFNGSTWVNINPGTGVTTGEPGGVTKTGANTASLVLDPTANTANNYLFRCVVTATGTGASATSANGRILITA